MGKLYVIFCFYLPTGSSVVEALPSAKKYALSLACRVFMGKEDWENVSDFSENFSLMTKGILSLPVNLPGTAMNRAMEGGRVVRRELMRIVGERRREMIKGEDLLSKMVVATNEDGECMSDGMVVNVILGLLIGAEHELSSLITIVLYYLAELPHIYDRVFKGTNTYLLRLQPSSPPLSTSAVATALSYKVNHYSNLFFSSISF
ncbi:beta-amyrin 6-beta-monooxygenase-like isoform X1 [Salvia splendens]|uniref:beta-amyrin 6-beta-monooxygenase-like isoform X1 n=1 Tax=Salvia splendens TaxID=180675 RepID=UPI001C253B1E|nr:beta-amyrin 6-beta-monooxygenase-like isoform X1 [Salvia splendens]